MFGIKPKGGMFGAPLPGQTPMGTPPIAPPMMDPLVPGAGMAPAPQQGGFNRPGGWAERLGMIGDVLTGNPIFTPQIRQRQQQELARQEYQRRQADEQATWLARQKWQRENPAPVNNDTIADYKFRVQTLGQDAADEWLRNQGDPIVTVPLGQDRIYSGPRSGLGAALGGVAAPAAGPPLKPVGKLTPLGGAGSQAPRTFP